MIRLIAVALLALAVGFGVRDVLPQPASAPAIARTAVGGAEAEVTLNAPSLL